MIVLFIASMALDRVIPLHQVMSESYPFRHAISFLTLTLPVLLWFWKWESSRYRATPGKRIMGLRVEASAKGGMTHADSNRHVFIRTVLKFLPWEWAHTFLHLNPDFITTGEIATSSLVYGLVLPQLIMMGYALTIAIRDDSRSPYDILSRTIVFGKAVTPVSK